MDVLPGGIAIATTVKQRLLRSRLGRSISSFLNSGSVEWVYSGGHHLRYNRQ